MAEILILGIVGNLCADMIEHGVEICALPGCNHPDFFMSVQSWQLCKGLCLRRNCAMIVVRLPRILDSKSIVYEHELDTSGSERSGLWLR